jgi:hypothetical protein
MKTFAMVLMSSSLLFLAGCGAPRFDASSDAAVDASMDRLSQGMSQEDKDKFGLAVAALTMTDGLKSAVGALVSQVEAPSGTDKPETVKTEMFKPLDGLTAAEIVARADDKKREVEGRMRR